LGAIQNCVLVFKILGAITRKEPAAVHYSGGKIPFVPLQPPLPCYRKALMAIVAEAGPD